MFKFIGAQLTEKVSSLDPELQDGEKSSLPFHSYALEPCKPTTFWDFGTKEVTMSNYERQQRWNNNIFR